MPESFALFSLFLVLQKSNVIVPRQRHNNTKSAEATGAASSLALAAPLFDELQLLKECAALTPLDSPRLYKYTTSTHLDLFKDQNHTKPRRKEPNSKTSGTQSHAYR